MFWNTFWMYKISVCFLIMITQTNAKFISRLKYFVFKSCSNKFYFACHKYRCCHGLIKHVKKIVYNFFPGLIFILPHFSPWLPGRLKGKSDGVSCPRSGSPSSTSTSRRISSTATSCTCTGMTLRCWKWVKLSSLSPVTKSKHLSPSSGLFQQ